MLESMAFLHSRYLVNLLIRNQCYVVSRSHPVGVDIDAVATKTTPFLFKLYRRKTKIPMKMAVTVEDMVLKKPIVEY